MMNCYSHRFSPRKPATSTAGYPEEAAARRAANAESAVSQQPCAEETPEETFTRCAARMRHSSQQQHAARMRHSSQQQHAEETPQEAAARRAASAERRRGSRQQLNDIAYKNVASHIIAD